MAKLPHYSGISFPPRKSGLSGFFAISTESALIKESIHVILNTRKGEMPMNAAFGSSIFEYLFEQVTAADMTIICSKITEDIETWEPRVEIVSIDAYSYENSRYFDIYARIRASGEQVTTTVSFSNDK